MISHTKTYKGFFSMQVCRLSRFALTLLLISAVFDGTMTARAQSEPDSDSNQPIEDVGAASTKSLKTLEAEATAAEDRLYEEYNRLNLDDNYDIVCRNESQPGTQLKKRVCRSRIASELVADNSQRFLRGEDGTATRGLIEHHQDVAMGRLAMLVQQHASLEEALVDFYTKKMIYQSEHDRRCDAKSLICNE